MPLDASVISSFEKRENPKEPEKPEKPLSQQKLSQILLNLTALPTVGAHKTMFDTETSRIITHKKRLHPQWTQSFFHTNISTV